MTREMSGLLSLMILCVSVLALTSCSTPAGSPEGAQSAFLNAMNEGKPEVAKDYVCGDIVIPPLPIRNYLQNVRSQTLDNTGVLAHIQTRADIIIEGIPGKKELDFTTTLKKDIDRWCIVKEGTFDSMLRAITTIR